MKTFKCDICNSYFERINGYANRIEFYNSYIENSNTDAICYKTLNMPNKQNGELCIYDICPRCFSVLRNTLWSLRGKVLTNISTNFDDKLITIPCGNNGAKIVFNIDVIKEGDQNE